MKNQDSESSLLDKVGWDTYHKISDIAITEAIGYFIHRLSFGHFMGQTIYYIFGVRAKQTPNKFYPHSLLLSIIIVWVLFGFFLATLMFLIFD